MVWSFGGAETPQSDVEEICNVIQFDWTDLNFDVRISLVQGLPIL